MKTKILDFFSKKDFFYNYAKKIISRRIIMHSELLKPEHLEALGWVYERETQYWTEPGVKPVHKIWIKFESHYFYLYSGEKCNYVTTQSKKDWFDMFFLFTHDNTNLYDLAEI